MFHPQPGSAWANGKLADLAEQLGKMVEHPKSMCHPVLELIKLTSKIVKGAALILLDPERQRGIPQAFWVDPIYRSQQHDQNIINAFDVQFWKIKLQECRRIHQIKVPDTHNICSKDDTK